MKPQLIVCAAIRNIRTGHIIAGPRHFDPVMHAQIKSQKADGDFVDADQGFLDNRGNFLNRKEAFKIAVKENQFREDPDAGYGAAGVLYSEDLY